MSKRWNAEPAPSRWAAFTSDEVEIIAGGAYLMALTLGFGDLDDAQIASVVEGGSYLGNPNAGPVFAFTLEAFDEAARRGIMPQGTTQRYVQSRGLENASNRPH